MLVPGRALLAVRSHDAGSADGTCPRCGLADVPGDPDMPWLAHLYLCAQLSTYRIAQLAGLDRQRVTRRLRRAGVPLRSRGGGGIRPQRRVTRPGLPELLTDLYLGQRLTIADVGHRLGIPARTVGDLLRRYGIQARTRGGWDRRDRRVLSERVLRDLYRRDGLSADAVGRKLEVSRKVVLRNAHEHGLPVRVGGVVQEPGPVEIELIRALYADPLVAEVLARRRIAQVRATGPVWQRFPRPVPLSRRLVAELYWGCGIALHHVELLTGQPAETVADFMRRTGIPLRPPGGRSPFLRRWRAGPAATAQVKTPDLRPAARRKRRRTPATAAGNARAQSQKGDNQ
jgi:hypothetical protein